MSNKPKDPNRRIVFFIFVAVLFLIVVAITLPLISQTNESARLINQAIESQR